MELPSPESSAILLDRRRCVGGIFVVHSGDCVVVKWMALTL